MDVALLLTQLVNGLQLGVLLFLVSAGLTLTFGIMDLINLAHAAFYMLGAFVGGSIALATGSFGLAVAGALAGTCAAALAVELGVVRHLYAREHLDQLLATFGLVLIADTLVQMTWGPAGLSVPLPEALRGRAELGPVGLPIYRLVIIGAGLAVALGLWWLVERTRTGMLIRAGASNRRMLGALGVNVGTLYAGVFAVGAALAGLGGMLIAPITEASIGMGNDIIITAFVVVIVGGVGSIRGAFVAAVLIGTIDTMGRAFLDGAFARLVSPDVAETAAPAVSAMLVYLLMAVVLVVRPQGLFPPKLR